jgi:hypothetical protein
LNAGFQVWLIFRGFSKKEAEFLPGNSAHEDINHSTGYRCLSA